VASAADTGSTADPGGGGTGGGGDGASGDTGRIIETPDLRCVRAEAVEGRTLTRQAQPERLRGGVGFYFTVEDCEGIPVEGLTFGDLVLTEDGAPIPPDESSATLLGYAPTNAAFVSLVLDRSASTAGFTGAIADAASGFVASIEREIDGPVYTSLVVFAGDVATYTANTADTEVLEQALAAAMKAEFNDPDPTSLNEALVTGLELQEEGSADYLQRNYGGALTTSYLVVFTDGADTTSTASIDDVNALQAALGTRTYAVALESASYRPEQLAAYAPEWRVSAASSPAALSDLFTLTASRIARLQNATYTLGYCSPQRSGSHVLEVAMAPIGASGTSEPASFTYDASDFTDEDDGDCGGGLDGASCSIEALEATCAGMECGGQLACGGCDDQRAACNGPAGQCVDFCTLGGYGEGETLVNPLGFTQVCDGVGLTRCGGAWVDTGADPRHCGSCDNPVGEGQYCRDGAITAATDPYLYHLSWWERGELSGDPQYLLAWNDPAINGFVTIARFEPDAGLTWRSTASPARKDYGARYGGAGDEPALELVAPGVGQAGVAAVFHGGEGRPTAAYPFEACYEFLADSYLQQAALVGDELWYACDGALYKVSQEGELLDVVLLESAGHLEVEGRPIIDPHTMTVFGDGAVVGLVAFYGDSDDDSTRVYGGLFEWDGEGRLVDWTTSAGDHERGELPGLRPEFNYACADCDTAMYKDGGFGFDERPSRSEGRTFSYGYSDYPSGGYFQMFFRYSGTVAYSDSNGRVAIRHLGGPHQPLWRYPDTWDYPDLRSIEVDLFESRDLGAWISFDETDVELIGMSDRLALPTDAIPTEDSSYGFGPHLGESIYLHLAVANEVEDMIELPGGRLVLILGEPEGGYGAQNPEGFDRYLTSTAFDTTVRTSEEDAYVMFHYTPFLAYGLTLE